RGRREHAGHYLVVTRILNLAVVAVIGVPEDPELTIRRHRGGGCGADSVTAPRHQRRRRPTVALIVGDESVPVDFVSGHHGYLAPLPLPWSRPTAGVLHLVAKDEPDSAAPVAIEPRGLQRLLFGFEHGSGWISGRFHPSCAIEHLHSNCARLADARPER